MVPTANRLAGSLGIAVLGTVFVALLGTDPQDAGARPDERSFTAALVGCSWLLLALAVTVGLPGRRLPGERRAPAGPPASR